MRALLAAILALAASAAPALADKCRVYMIYGQGGYLFSPGFASFGGSLEAKGYNVSYWTATRPDLIVSDVLRHPDDKICLLGYSLGANSVSWVSSGWQGGSGLDAADRTVDLVVSYDPTVNTYSTPLTSNVKRAIVYQQVSSWWPTSIFFGRAALTSAPGGPDIKTYQVSNDHLYVQFNGALHATTERALEEVGK